MTEKQRGDVQLTRDMLDQTLISLEECGDPPAITLDLDMLIIEADAMLADDETDSDVIADWQREADETLLLADKAVA